MAKQYNKAYIFGITLVATLGDCFSDTIRRDIGAEKSIEAYLIRPLGLNSLIHGATSRAL